MGPVNYREFLSPLLSEMHFAPLAGSPWELDNFSLRNRDILKCGIVRSLGKTNIHEQGGNMKPKFRDEWDVASAISCEPILLVVFVFSCNYSAATRFSSSPSISFPRFNCAFNCETIARMENSFLIFHNNNYTMDLNILKLIFFITVQKL